MTIHFGSIFQLTVRPSTGMPDRIPEALSDKGRDLYDKGMDLFEQQFNPSRQAEVFLAKAEGRAHRPTKPKGVRYSTDKLHLFLTGQDIKFLSALKKLSDLIASAMTNVKEADREAFLGHIVNWNDLDAEIKALDEKRKFADTEPTIKQARRINKEEKRILSRYFEGKKTTLNDLLYHKTFGAHIANRFQTHGKGVIDLTIGLKNPDMPTDRPLNPEDITLVQYEFTPRQKTIAFA